MKTSPLVLALLLTAACGGGPAAQHKLTAPSPTPSPTHSPIPPAQGPHFDTPEAAMRYLAAAWNSGNITNLKHVTDPSARMLLIDMHSEATNLKLEKCTRNTDRQDYDCTFTHDFPPGFKHDHAVGKAGFVVGPADRPGWYMTVFEYCGDGGGG